MLKPVSASSPCAALMTNILDAVPEEAPQTRSGVYHIPLSGRQRPYRKSYLELSFYSSHDRGRQELSRN